MIRRSKFSVSPACQNRVTWLATSANLLALLAVVRIKPLCQAPLPWHHNAISWWHHIQNITSFRNLESDTLSNVINTGKYWLHFVVLTSRDKNKTVVAWYSPPDLPRGVRGRGWPAVSPAAADSPREIWWTVSRNNTVLLSYQSLSSQKMTHVLPSGASYEASIERVLKTIGCVIPAP